MNPPEHPQPDTKSEPSFGSSTVPSPPDRSDVSDIERYGSSYLNFSASTNAQPQSTRRRVKKSSVIYTLTVLVIAAGIVGYQQFKDARYHTEVDTGARYIQAIRNKDYTTLESLADPKLKETADSIAQSGGAVQKQDFYEGFLDTSGQASAAHVGDSTPIVNKITPGQSGTQKYIVIIYKTDSDYVTAVEDYDSSNVAHVLMIVAGSKKFISNDSYQSLYDAYQKDMTSIAG